MQVIYYKQLGNTTITQVTGMAQTIVVSSSIGIILMGI